MSTKYFLLQLDTFSLIEITNTLQPHISLSAKLSN